MDRKSVAKQLVDANVKIELLENELKRKDEEIAQLLKTIEQLRCEKMTDMDMDNKLSEMMAGYDKRLDELNLKLEHYTLTLAKLTHTSTDYIRATHHVRHPNIPL